MTRALRIAAVGFIAASVGGCFVLDYIEYRSARAKGSRAVLRDREARQEAWRQLSPLLDEEIADWNSRDIERPPVGEPGPGTAFTHYAEAFPMSEARVDAVAAAVRTSRLGPAWSYGPRDVSALAQAVRPGFDAALCDAKRARDPEARVRLALTLVRAGDDLGPGAYDLRALGIAHLRDLLEEEHVDGAARVEMRPVLSGLLQDRPDAAGLMSRVSVPMQRRLRGRSWEEAEFATWRQVREMEADARRAAGEGQGAAAAVRTIGTRNLYRNVYAIPRFAKDLIELAEQEERDVGAMEALVLGLAALDWRDRGAEGVPALSELRPPEVREHPDGGDWRLVVASDASLQIRLRDSDGSERLMLWLR
jgi:hypothetical protein